MNQSRFQKAPFPGLHPFQVCGYSFLAVAKSAAGRRNPCNSQATRHAPCVFFYVVAQVYPFFELWCLHPGSSQIMVIRAGQLSGWPVFCEAGIPTPVRVTTHECRNSGGGINRYSQEVALMASTLAPTHPQFVFVFAAVRRTERTRRVFMLRTVAGDEHAARLSLVRDYILSFAARLPVAEAAHA